MFTRLVTVIVGSVVLGGLTALPAVAATSPLTTGSTPHASWRVNGRVYATRIVGDTVVVGGSFTTATSPSGASAPRANLAAFSLSTGALLTGWRADTDAAVRALETDGTSVYVAGAFMTLGGATHRRVGKVSVATGAVDARFAGALGATGRALELDGSSVFVGGEFVTAGGQPRNRVAEFDAVTGALDPSFKPDVSDTVAALAKSPSSPVLYIGGSFTTVNGAARVGAAGVDRTTGATSAITFEKSDKPVLSLDVNADGSRLLAGQAGSRNSVVSWDTVTAHRHWKVKADGDIQALRFYDGYVYAGFHDGYQGVTTTKLLAIKASTGKVDPFRPTFDGFWGVFAIDVTSAGLVVGGDFTKVSGVAAQGWARF